MAAIDPEHVLDAPIAPGLGASSAPPNAIEGRQAIPNDIEATGKILEANEEPPRRKSFWDALREVVHAGW